jgi:hypothetical protein
MTVIPKGEMTNISSALLSIFVVELLGLFCMGCYVLISR